MVEQYVKNNLGTRSDRILKKVDGIIHPEAIVKEILANNPAIQARIIRRT